VHLHYKIHSNYEAAVFHQRIVCCYLYPITKYGYPPKAEDTLKYIDEMHALGFRSVEIEGIRKEHLLRVYDMRFDIKKTLDTLNLELPYFCAVLPGLSSPDENVRKANLDLFEKGCEAAKLFGSKGILDNAPLPPFQFPGDIPVVRHYGEESLRRAFFPKNFSWNAYWDILTDTFRTVCEISARFGLTYQVHPAVGVLSSTTDGFLHFFESVKRDNLRFNFDAANLFAVKENLSLALLRLHDHIDYIHISDNGGERVEHLSIGDGTIDWDVFFETLQNVRYKGYFGVDVGGSESRVPHLDESYKNTARWLEEKILQYNFI